MTRRRWKLVAGLAAAMAAAGGLWLARLVIAIDRQSSLDEARPADVIVILGAAAYRGRPSPVLRARLDHGLELYRRGLAPLILTTGGSGGDPHFTESEVGRAYLVGRGVPSEAIIIEPESESTAQSTAAVAEIMRRMKLRSCIVVSDGYHIFRAKKFLEKMGLAAYGSPRPSPPPRKDLRYWQLCARQAVGYMLWVLRIRV